MSSLMDDNSKIPVARQTHGDFFINEISHKSRRKVMKQENLITDMIIFLTLVCSKTKTRY
jgi:hypothetical protein